MSRKLIYYVATTVDQFIAHADGGVGGFLTEGEHIPDYMNSLRDYDTVIMGKNTYEFGYAYGLKAGEPVPTYGHMMQYVMSQTMPEYHHPQLQVIRQDPAEFVRGLKSQAGGQIYLCGGGALAGYLLDHALIDDLIVKVNPVLFGDGIPLFGESKRQVGLIYRHSKIYPTGVIFTHYVINYG
ncbi:MAG: dihydrofolate reductase family protein [Anaerolineae bacterium]|nr:dihydrofolate reductase family protein [Anaerolineae bacterium]